MWPWYVEQIPALEYGAPDYQQYGEICGSEGPGGGEWAALERHPAVVRHLAADRRCLPAAALRPNVSQGSEAWCRLQRAKCRAPRG